MSSSPAPSTPPAPVAAGKLVKQPWVHCGLSRSTWFRLAAADATPKPVRLPGCSRPHYRAADLDRWISGLPTKR